MKAWLEFSQRHSARARAREPESALIAAALERDRWSAEQWRAWREERLAFILHRAATRVPYYRAYWSIRRRLGDRTGWDRLEAWPVLEKDRLRDQPRAFVADDCDPGRLQHEQTSGTTGKAIDVWRTGDTVRELQAMSSARTLGWDGIPETTRWVRLTSFQLSPEQVPSYLDALRRHRIGYLAGYASSLTVLARSALMLGRADLRMRAVYTNAEPLTEDQRHLIGRAFQCPVHQTYGMTEFVAAGSECPDGTMHQWPEMGHIEVADGGELLCTGLLNADMPLIRYRVGDRGHLAGPGAPCPCGRTLPAIARIEGRTSDLVLTRDGRRVFRLNPVFYGLPVRESQIIQERIDRLRVLVARAEGFNAWAARTIAARLQDLVGDVAVDVEFVDTVPHTANGRVRAVICRLLAPERRKTVRLTPAGAAAQ